MKARAKRESMIEAVREEANQAEVDALKARMEEELAVSQQAADEEAIVAAGSVSTGVMVGSACYAAADMSTMGAVSLGAGAAVVAPLAMAAGYTILGNELTHSTEAGEERLGVSFADWDPDATRCYACNKRFGVLLHRHHCRGCGRNVCGNCSPNTAVIQGCGYGDLPQRICGECHGLLRLKTFRKRMSLDNEYMGD